MRIAVCVIALAAVASTAAADSVPCATGAECEKACNATPVNGAACTAGAELYFDGMNNHPLDHKKSFALAKRGCDHGEAHACMLLGYHYQDGLGAAPWDPKLAVDAYVKGCTKGFGVACYNLSGMYIGGHGVPFDKAKADQFKKLADTHWEAQCKAKDTTRWCANHGFALATAGDKKGARKAHQRACEHGARVGCVEAARLGLELRELDTTAYLAELDRQCKAGEPTACTARGEKLLLGDKTLKADPAKGLEHLRRGCELGDKMGCMSAVYELMKLRQDGPTAMKYLNMACDRALGLACAELSRLSFAVKREPESVAYAVRACRIGHAESCGYAGQSYVEGKVVTKDEKQGTAYLRDGCRMADTPSCGVLIRRNEELPVPEEHKQKLYSGACKAGIKEACPRVKP